MFGNYTSTTRKVLKAGSWDIRFVVNDNGTERENRIVFYSNVVGHVLEAWTVSQHQGNRFYENMREMPEAFRERYISELSNNHNFDPYDFNPRDFYETLSYEERDGWYIDE